LGNYRYVLYNGPRYYHSEKKEMIKKILKDAVDSTIFVMGIFIPRFIVYIAVMAFIMVMNKLNT